MRDEIRERFEANLARVRNLIQIYEQVARPTPGRQQVGTIDILRAATVFLHAALEEVFRNAARWKYPAAPQTLLNEIPLVGTSGRPERYLLGHLASHREKTVQEVINQSVEEYLDRFTVNNVPEAIKVLSKLGINPNSINEEFPVLAELFERRHHIVHQADRNDLPGPGHHEARGLNRATVSGWVGGVERFINQLLAQIPD